jgi:hypothetical protein
MTRWQLTTLSLRAQGAASAVLGVSLAEVFLPGRIDFFVLWTVALVFALLAVLCEAYRKLPR